MKRPLTFLLCLAWLPLLAANGDIGGCAITPDGLFIQVWFSGYGTNTAAMGILTNGIVTPTNFITITYNSPGFDENLTTNNLSRTAVATFQRRRFYPDQATKWVDIQGSYAVAYFALESTIHSSDWGITASINANCYSNNTAYSNPVTNNSVIPQPRVIAMWRTVSRQLMGSNVTLMATAYHASGQEGRSVRAMKFWATDMNGNNTATNTVTTPTTNNYFVTTLDYGPLSQGSTVSNHFKAIPWAGTPLSTADGAHPPDHPDYGPLLAYCDKSNRWMSVIALVDPVNGTTAGVATTNWSTATNGTLAAFATIAQAKNAAGATNNANGTNSYSNCYIILTNGAYTWMGGETPATRNGALTTWTHFMPWPGVNWTNVQIYSNTASQVGQKTDFLHFKNLYFSWSNNVGLVNNGHGYMWFDNCLIGTNTSGSGVKLFDFQTNVWVTGCDVLYSRNTVFVNEAGQANSSVRMFDNTFYQFIANSSVPFAPSIAVGNTFKPVGTQQQYTYKNGQVTTAPLDPFIFAYNYLYNQDNTVYPIDLRSTNLTVGGVVACNMVEGVKVGGGFALDIAISQIDNENWTNLMVWRNTILGITHFPFDFGFSNVTRVDIQSVNNLYADYEYKGDVRNATNSATNTSCILYSVDCSGNSYWDINLNSFMPSVTELGFDALNSSFTLTNQSRSGFINNQSFSSAATNAFGNYRLNSDSWVRLGAPLRRRPLLFDITGAYIGNLDPPGAYNVGSPRKGDFIGL